MDSEDLLLAAHGAQFFSGLAVNLLPGLFEVAERYPDGKAGIRIVGDECLAKLLGPHGVVASTLNAISTQPVWPVRAVLFDKSDAANWALGWHQDRTIAVRERCEAPGYGPWTIKQGIQHVEPPFALTESMLTVRVHLDPVDKDNGPLLVALGSHGLGLVPAEDVAVAAEAHDCFACLASPGDVWVYSTPILHASRAARPGRRRRVLQVDYASQTLPHGLEWLGI